jgi:hypothetical protein
MAPSADAADGAVGAYVVPLECPARSVWLEGLRVQLPPLLRAHPLIEGLSVHIERSVEPGSHGLYVGALAGEGRVAAIDTRTVRGSSCEEVLDALTFIGALSLERVVTGADPQGAPRAEPDALDAPSAEPASAALDRDAGREPSPPEDVERLRLGAQVFFLVQRGMAPGHSFDRGLGGSLSFDAGSFQPWFMLGVYFGASEEGRPSGVGARFEHWSSHVVGCPWRFPRQGAFGVRPCLDLDVGRTSAEGLRIADATRRSAPWLSGGAQLRASYSFGDRVELGGSLGVAAPVFHSRFYFLPESTASETPPMTFRAGAFAGLRF